MFEECPSCGIIFRVRGDRRYCSLCLKKLNQEERLLIEMEKSIGLFHFSQFNPLYASKYL